jgi:hypothetical protein
MVTVDSLDGVLFCCDQSLGYFRSGRAYPSCIVTLPISLLWAGKILEVLWILKFETLQK